MHTITDPIATYVAAIARIRELEAELAEARRHRAASVLAAREFHGTKTAPASRRLIAELAGERAGHPISESTVREHLNVAHGGKRSRGAR